jgi:gamma-glutamyltranspeptidase / glutathione hydrolase
LTVAVLAVLLSSCSGDGGDEATPRYIEGFVGGVATDEPQAAFVGREILAANGNAVDAAVATYFALAVTLPSSASLGSGGICVAFDAERNETRTIDFLARAPSVVDPGSSRPAAIPGAVRGFYTLHAYYGRLHWSELVAPAERLARFGASVSRAYAEDLAALGDALRAEPSFVRIFGNPDSGGLVNEGDTMVQVELASVLSRLRSQGPAGFYTGPQAAEFLRAVDQAGGSIPRMDLDGYQAAWRPTLEVGLNGNQVAHVASPPPSGGVIAGQIVGMLAEADRYADATPGERGHLLVEASGRAFADREHWQQAGDAAAGPAQDLVAPEHLAALLKSYRADARQPADPSRPHGPLLENPAAASIVTVDREGSAVACSITLNSLFGTGRIAAGTGILLASLPGPGGRGATALAPMVVTDDDKEDFYFAAAASGGSAGPTALAGVAAQVLLVGETLDRALAQHRVLGAIDLDRAFVERGADDELIAALRQRGHAVALTGGLGRVDAISCRAGLPDAPQTCNAAADPRGSGLAIMAD